MPTEAPEGVIEAGGLSLSITETEILDLISEGEIEGPVTGQFITSGNIGDLGYSSFSERLYPIAPSTSNTRWLRSIFWNDTPVVSSNNKFNFQDVSLTTIAGLPDGSTVSSSQTNLTISRQISERLRGAPSEDLTDPVNSDFVKTYRILNKDASGTFINVKVEQLLEQIREGENTGDIVITSVKYSIYYRAIFSNPNKEQDFILGKNEEITGKITGGYIRSSRIDFEDASNYVNDVDFQGWEVKIVRTTPDSTTSALRNQTFINSLTEIYSDTFTYPNSAIIRSKFNAEFFSQVPARNFHVRGLKVKVPTNYNPRSKTYGLDDGAPAGLTDFWAGEFKDDKEWTDNPAWCFYDLLTNRRYGLGKFINSDLVDKFTLYEIAKYCDTLVADGKGGVEPRFSANLIINTRSEAYKVVNDMASIFNGLVYYSAGGIFSVADQPKTPIFSFTNANVGNGEFNYSSSSKRVRNTVVLVRYNDKNNFFKSSIETVEDTEAIKRYGIRQLELNGFGVTSRGQAVRVGRWALLTEFLENESINFTAGLEGHFLRPGDVFRVHDQDRVAKRFGGRTTDIKNTSLGSLVTLDDEIVVNNDSIYNFSLLTPTNNLDSSLDNITGSNQFSDIRKSQVQTLDFTGVNVSPITGTDNRVRSKIDFSPKIFDTGDFTVSGDLIWTYELSKGMGSTDTVSGQYDLYRALNIKEADINRYEISAIKYDESKFQLVETGLAFDTQAESQQVPAPNSPENLQLTITQITENTKRINFSFTIADDSNVQEYFVYAKQNADLTDSDVETDNSFLISTLPSSTRNGSFIPSEDGTYYFRVYSRNSLGTLSSSFASNNIFVGNVNPILDVEINSLRLDNDEDDNPAGTTHIVETNEVSPVYEWKFGVATESLSVSNIRYRITVRPPTEDNIPHDLIYYETTGYVSLDSVIPNFTFDLDTNSSIDVGPLRSYDLIVEAHNRQGKSSAGGNFLSDVNDLSFNDALYTNSDGYDIINVDNPKITGIRLTDILEGETISESLGKGINSTDQFINTNGNIDITITSGTLNKIKDFAGLLVYYDTGSFTQSQASGQEIKRVNVPAGTIEQKNFVAPVDWATVETGYIAIAAYDVFDANTVNQIDFSGIEISNVVQINQRGAYDDTELRTLITENFQNLETVSGRVDILESQVSGIVGTDSDIILTHADNYVLVDSSAGEVNVHLSDASGVGISGHSVTIKDWKGMSVANNILILPTGEQFIDDFTGIRMNVDFESFTLLSNGTGWSII